MPSGFARALGSAFLSAALLLDASVAWGDPREDSRAAFLRGVSEAHQDHFTAARDAFLEAYQLFPHPSILLNLGVARLHTGEYVAAEEDLRHFLAADGGAPPEDLADARATLKDVRRHLGTLRIHVVPGDAHATLDGVPLTLTDAPTTDVRAATGPGKLHVEADGYTPVDRPVVVARDEVLPVDVTLTPTTAAAPDAAAAKPTGRARHTTLGWSLVGGAGVLGVVGIVAGVEAISAAHDYNTPGNPGYQSHSTRETGVAWRTSADVLFVTGAAAGATGAFFLLVPLPLGRGAEMRAAVSLCAVTAGVTF